MIQYDNTELVKNQSSQASDQINFIDYHVAPIAPIRVGNAPSLEAEAYHVNGMLPSILKSIDGDTGSVQIKGQEFERWVKMEELKDSPWSDEEKKQYWNHRKNESERSQAQTKQVLKAYDKRREIAKAFTGR